MMADDAVLSHAEYGRKYGSKAQDYSNVCYLQPPHFHVFCFILMTLLVLHRHFIATLSQLHHPGLLYYYFCKEE